MTRDCGWVCLPAKSINCSSQTAKPLTNGFQQGYAGGQLFASAFCSKQGVSGVSPTWAFNMQHPLSSHQSGASVDRGVISPFCDVATNPGSQAVNGWSGV